MNISLTPELNALVKSKVASGMYNNASEVIREALRLLHEQDELRALKLELLKKELYVGLEALERGEYGSQSVDEIGQRVLNSFNQEKP